MPLFIRLFTGVLVVGGVAGVVWADSLLVAAFVGGWTLALAYIGLAIAAYWEDVQ
jgi:hypothetical protein